MKKILAFVAVSAFVWSTASAQEDDTKKKFRAGLKFSAQPSWFQSSDPNTTKLKTGFGYGFGLVTDFRLSDVIYFSTGIGGDFENSSIKYRDKRFSLTTKNNKKGSFFFFILFFFFPFFLFCFLIRGTIFLIYKQF